MTYFLELILPCVGSIMGVFIAHWLIDFEKKRRFKKYTRIMDEAQIRRRKLSEDEMNEILSVLSSSPEHQKPEA